MNFVFKRAKQEKIYREMDKIWDYITIDIGSGDEDILDSDSELNSDGYWMK